MAKSKTKRTYAGRNAPIEEARDARLQVRVTSDQLEQFKKAAAKEVDIDVSAWARRILVKAAEKVLSK